MGKGIEMPLSFIIFLIILVVIFVIVLVWNFSGAGTFKEIVLGNVACDVVSESSRGVLESGC